MAAEPTHYRHGVGILDEWRFCPRCAGELTAGEIPLHCLRCGYDAWANSVPGAQAVIERDGRVLLGRRRQDPGRGLWDLPGGFLDEAEHPWAALKREVLEETGLEIEAVEFLGFWTERYFDRYVLCITWLATSVGGAEAAGDDLAELRWFARDELPPAAELAFPTYAEILDDWRRRPGRARR
jgi:8-oxo-dGTP diphosphatase